MQRKQRHGLFRGAQCQDKRQWAQRGTQDALSEHQEAFQCYAGGWPLVNFPREVVDSPPWRSSKVAWTQAWAACSGYPCLSRAWSRWTWESSQMFCEFVTAVCSIPIHFGIHSKIQYKNKKYFPFILLFVFSSVVIVLSHLFWQFKNWNENEIFYHHQV